MNKKNKKTWTVMARAMTLVLLVLLPMSGTAQRMLTLDSCRAMALRNNKQLGMARVKQEVNANLRKSARTQYLPKVNAMAGYLWTSKEISILNDEQKSALSSMGTNAATSLQNALAPLASTLPAATQVKIGQDLSAFAGTARERHRNGQLIPDDDPHFRGAYRIVWGKALCYGMIGAVAAAYLGLACLVYRHQFRLMKKYASY